MLETFYPDEYVDSAYGLPFEELYEKGFRGMTKEENDLLISYISG